MLTRCLAALFLLLSTCASATDFAQALQSPHYVLLVRHAYAPGVGDPPNYSLDRCEGQRLLNEEGRAQATRMGHWLRQQGVQSATVLSSVWCRCTETASRLGFGGYTLAPSLASFFDEPSRAAAQTAALQQLLAQALPAKGSNALVLVTHHVNIAAFTGENIGSGDMVLARIGQQGQLLSFRVYPSP
jgi:phosphohistidine phosphatase SixA